MGNSASGEEEGVSAEATNKREQVANELLATEETYIRGLQTLDRTFGDAVRGASEAERRAMGVGDADVELLFGDLRELIALHSRIRAELRVRCAKFGPKTMLGPVFSPQMLNPLFAPYARVITRNEAAQARYDAALAAKKSGPRLRAFLDDVAAGALAAEAERGGGPANALAFSIPALLITPVQRIPRYLLMLKDLAKRTPASHRDYGQLMRAVAAVESFAASLNEARVHAEQHDELVAHCATVVDLPPPLMAAIAASPRRSRAVVSDVGAAIHLPLAVHAAEGEGAPAVAWTAAGGGASASGSAVVHEGFLSKANRSRLARAAKGWNERWFQLAANGRLAYWRSEESVTTEAAAGVISLGDVVSVAAMGPATLHISTLQRGYTLLARSESEAEEWHGALRATLAAVFVERPVWLGGAEVKDGRSVHVIDDMLVVTKHTKKRMKKIERYKAHVAYTLARRLPPSSVRVVDIGQLVGEPDLALLDIFTRTATYVPVDPRTTAAGVEDVAVGAPGVGFAIRLRFASRADLALVKTEVMFALSVAGLLARPAVDLSPLADDDDDAEHAPDAPPPGDAYAGAGYYACAVM